MARYKVEHCDTRGVWVPMHRGSFRRYSDALAKKQAFCRVMADYSGNGVWEEVDSYPNLYEQGCPKFDSCQRTGTQSCHDFGCASKATGASQ